MTMRVCQVRVMTTFINPKILVIDIETLMGQAFIWRMYDEVTNINMLIKPTTILSWAAKWVDGEYVYFDSIKNNTREGMMENLWHLLDEAEVVIGWNSNRFDIRHINAEFMELGFSPPSPYRKVDLLQHVRRQAKFMSNKLDYIAQVLGLGRKLDHEGVGLWFRCLEDDEEAWQTMEAYNIQDVELTEQVFHRVRPWLPYTINRSIEGGVCCSECGSTNLQSRGTRAKKTQTRLYDRFRCNDCGSWIQSVSSRKNVSAVMKKEAM